MKKIEKINDYTHRLILDYKDIFTTVYAVETQEGYLVLDMGSNDEDAELHIIPFMKELGITAENLKYIFISHNHRDHAGGLAKVMESFPRACIVSGSDLLKEKFADYHVHMPEDGEVLAGVLQCVTIPGHTQDSAGVLDTRTKTLISGDSMQLYGILGSGQWGANISLPKAHIEAINKLKKMDIACIFTAHDYQPYGQDYIGKETVVKALDACIEPLMEVKKLIEDNKNLDDEAVCNLYNDGIKPTLGVHVVTAVRAMMA